MLNKILAMERWGGLEMSPGWQIDWLGVCPLELGKGSSELHTI